MPDSRIREWTPKSNSLTWVDHIEQAGAGRGCWGPTCVLQDAEHELKFGTDVDRAGEVGLIFAQTEEVRVPQSLSQQWCKLGFRVWKTRPTFFIFRLLTVLV